MLSINLSGTTADKREQKVISKETQPSEKKKNQTKS